MCQHSRQENILPAQAGVLPTIMHTGETGSILCTKCEKGGILLHYRLQEYCRLVAGARRGAIYNLQTGKVLSVNQGALELLLSCQQSPLEDILDLKAPEDKIFTDFLHRLAEMGLGSFFLDKPAPAKVDTLPAEPSKLNFLWLEITSACNNKCLHCYATSGPSSSSDAVPHQRWLSLIAEARAAGASAIQFIGGEPLLYPRWRELAEKACAEGFEFIEIFTNATLVDDSCVDFCQKHKIHIATTIYADNAAVHDRVTLNPGSFAKTMAAIEKILAAKVPLRIASIIMKANEREAENIMKLCAGLGVEATPPDIVRPTGRGDDKDLLPTVYTKPPIRPPFYTDAESFAKAQRCHSCLDGKIAVTAGGDVIPCIFARSEVCGNILTAPLADVLKEQRLQQCWHTTKDSVEKCKDCEYRYACTDCRPLAQGSDSAKRWLACSVGCPYNPYTGKWEE
jgi:Predicted Fe-S oxidoreductases